MDKRNLAGNASQGFSIRDRHLKKRIEEELGIPLEEKAPTVNAVFRTSTKRLRIWNCAIRKPLFTQVQKRRRRSLEIISDAENGRVDSCTVVLSKEEIKIFLGEVCLKSPGNVFYRCRDGGNFRTGRAEWLL